MFHDDNMFAYIGNIWRLYSCNICKHEPVVSNGK